METGAMAWAGATVLVIGAIVAGILQILSKLNELKTKTVETATAVDGRMSAVEKGQAAMQAAFEKRSAEMLAAFEHQLARAQAGETAARSKQDEVTADALADANERGRVAMVAAVVAGVAAPVPPPAPVILDENGHSLKKSSEVATLAADTATSAAGTVEAAGKTVDEIRKNLSPSKPPGGT